jgi:hypothetical protein
MVRYDHQNSSEEKRSRSLTCKQFKCSWVKIFQSRIKAEGRPTLLTVHRHGAEGFDMTSRRRDAIQRSSTNSYLRSLGLPRE